jgi:hypothetical protein
VNLEERAERQMAKGPIQNVRRVIELEDAIDDCLHMNDVEVERMRARLASTLQTGLRVRVQLQLTSEQRKELLIEGAPEVVIADKLRRITDHTGQTFDLPS